jgi:uncharacterized RDD family membrane protein YckC
MSTPRNAGSPWRTGRSAASAMNAVPVEARAFQGHRAGIVTKVVANAIDLGLTVLSVAGLYFAYAALLFLINPRGFSFPSPNFALMLLIGGAIMTGYFWISWATVGRTYGDHVLGLRVVGWRGDQMRWIPALLRALFCVVFMLGLFWTVISRQNRSVQDTVLRTSVIYDWEVHTGAPRHSEVPNEFGEPLADPGADGQADPRSS